MKNLLSIFVNGIQNKWAWFGGRTLLKIVWYEVRYAFTFPTHALQLFQHHWGQDRDQLRLCAVTPYFFLREAFAVSGIPYEGSVLVDYGCGSGRALLYASQQGFKRVIGIDFNSELCALATQNFESYIKKNGPLQPAWSVVNADVVDYEIPSDANVFYLSDPFQEDVMFPVVDNILRSAEQQPREIFVIYVSPSFHWVFPEDRFETLYMSTSARHHFLAVLKVIPDTRRLTTGAAATQTHVAVA